VTALLVFAPRFRGPQTALDPVGPQALRIEHTLFLIFWITSVVTVIVLTVLAVGVLRQHSRGEALPPPLSTDPQKERRATWVVGWALGITVALLFVMLTASFITSHRTAALAASPALKINVYGHEWWWEVEYPIDEQPYRMVRTANEIHVPAGAIVDIHGTSRDVIHSFWAPNIHGKKDLLPGYWNDLTIEVDKPGTWRGQCAEFCGLQHAHMAFNIVAQSREDFDNWYVAQLKAANEPTNSQTRRGREIFLSHPCVMCHTIRGTTAAATVGPDLTHIGSRTTLAAGTLVNNTGNLTGWIANAQSIKPGCRMPPNPMPSTDLNDLVAYMESLR
jgi:cytochrome c oxidase subunit II